MERSEALGGLVIAVAALVVAVGTAVFVTAEGSTPARPLSVEELGGDESRATDTRVQRSGRERGRDRAAAPASSGRARDDRPAPASEGAVETGAATVVAAAQTRSAPVTDDADRWESDDDYDDGGSDDVDGSGGDHSDAGRDGDRE